MANAILNIRSSRAALVAAITTVMNAVPEVLANQTFNNNGVKMTSAQAVAQLAAGLVTLASSIAATEQVHQTKVAEDAMRVALKVMTENMLLFAGSVLGTSSAQYASLGFSKKKAAALTVEELAARAVKAKATRAARNTIGPAQKKKIHGAPSAEPNAPAAKKGNGGGNGNAP
jgi:hypothetical protein